MNVLLGISGGIAAYKSAYIASGLKKEGFGVDVVMTGAAAKFVAPLTFETLTNNPVAVDMFDDKRSWEVEHIALAKKADAAILAPATANTIAKLACGIADNMLTTVFLALECPVVIAPAMNTAMYDNIATRVNLQILKDRGFYIMEPGEGALACGDSGKGRMREPDEVIAFFKQAAGLVEGRLTGKKVLITAGPTCEAIDPVRYISNRSSGKMGYALAEAALKMGAEVTLISGPVSISPPPGAEVVGVTSAQQMHDEVMGRKAGRDVIIMCAAVADYAPKEAASSKMKKKDTLTLELVKTKDILKDLGAEKDFYLAGFAAETNDIEAYAAKKLEEKNLDMIIANDVSGSDTGFDSDFNAVTIMKRGGGRSAVEKDTKRNIAARIMEEIAAEL